MKELFNVWKIDLVIKIVFSFSKGDDEHGGMYSQQDLVLLIIGEQTEDIVESIFHELLKKYQDKMVLYMKGSDFIFDYVHKTYYHCNKISLNRGEN